MHFIHSRIGVPLIAALVITWACTSAAVADTQWGEIVYPLPGNLRSDAGTLLVHFRIEADDLEAEPGPWYFPQTVNPYYRFKVLNLDLNADNDMMLYWFRGRSGRGRIHAALGDLPSSPQSMTDRNGRVSGDWQPYEQHWIAYTWDERGTHTYWADGQIIRQQGVNVPELGLGAVADDGRLTLGANISPITVYGVHVLDHPLAEEQLLEVTPDEVAMLFERMDGSLLLDRFNGETFEPDGEQQTRATVISGFTDETGGTPTADCRFVTTPFGRGLRLYTPPADVEIP